MVLILTDKNDLSTIEVLDWLIYYDIPFLKLTKNDLVRINWHLNNIILDIGGREYLLSEFTSYWYRRGNLRIFFEEANVEIFDYLLGKEKRKLVDFFYYKLEQISHIGSYEKSEVNKLIVSSEARKVGLLTPDDFILNSKKELLNLLNRKGKFSTKTISGYLSDKKNNSGFLLYTSLLEKDEIKTHNFENFFPSLVQSYIEKKIELRVFFLNGTTYAMAIFSQDEKETSVDSRRIDPHIVVRTVPYIIPKKIDKKIIKLMHCLDINCGTLDFIVTPENKYFFLELNPIGQFRTVSLPCNYGLEELIAKALMSK